MKAKCDFSIFVSSFFSDYLVNRKNASSHTILSYRDTFKLLLHFMSEQGLKPEKLSISMVDRFLIMNFLEWLENERKCSVTTQNQRLSALHSFFRYVQEDPQYLSSAQTILSIPYKKASKPVVNFLSTNGIKALLEQPDTNTPTGRRDFVLLTVLYDTGARVQELADLTVGDVIFDRYPYIVLTGKGRKSRMVPLMKESAQMIKEYINQRPESGTRKDSPLFPNRMGQKMTRAGISYILEKYTAHARISAPEEIPDKVTPHCLRHSKAMHLLQADVNLVYIRDFLGHNDVKTTEIYARADSESKRKALQNAYPDLAPKRDLSWRDDKSLMAWLKSL